MSAFFQSYVLHHYKLTRFSNTASGYSKLGKFYTITNLQGSQTHSHSQHQVSSFTPLQTYKVLKRVIDNRSEEESFTPLQTYKVLKPQISL